MSFKNLKLAVALVAALVAMGGCGGCGHSAVVSGDQTKMVSGASFQIVWPMRSRNALTTGLTSALSCQIVLKAADANGQDVTLKFDRDSTKVAGYTGTYQVGQPIRAATNSIVATFYAQPAEAGPVVGTATTGVSISGTAIDFTKIVLQGVIHSVAVVNPGTLLAASSATQLQFTTKDASGNTVAVTPGSAIWSVASGGAYLTLTKDGIATPVSAGSAVVSATVDGITSPTDTITVGSAGAKGTYRMVVIPGSLSGDYSCSINASGEAVINPLGSNGNPAAYAWTQAGGVTEVSEGSSTSSSLGSAINDSGEIVGEVFSGSGATSTAEPAVWSSSSTTPVEPAQTFGSGNSGAGTTYLWGVNNSGAFVGGTQLAGNSDSTATYWASSTATPVKMSAGSAVGAIAFAINTGGEIAGNIQVSNSATAVTHACIWSSYSAAPTLLKEISGGTSSGAVALNSYGEVLGWEAESDGKQHVLIWSTPGATPKDISPDSAPTVALFSPKLIGSLNDSGVAVWLSVTNELGGEIYTPASGVKNLTTLLDSSGAGYAIYSAAAINDNGWIVGSALSNGIYHPVVLIPN